MQRYWNFKDSSHFSKNLCLCSDLGEKIRKGLRREKRLILSFLDKFLMYYLEQTPLGRWGKTWAIFSDQPLGDWRGENPSKDVPTRCKMSWFDPRSTQDSQKKTWRGQRQSAKASVMTQWQEPSDYEWLIKTNLRQVFSQLIWSAQWSFFFSKLCNTNLWSLTKIFIGSFFFSPILYLLNCPSLGVPKENPRRGVHG